MIKKFLKRFEKLENAYVDNLFSSPENFNGTKRFERLEINDKKIEFSITDKVAPQEEAPAAVNYYIICHHCGQENPANTEICGYCKQPFRKNFIAD